MPTSAEPRPLAAAERAVLEHLLTAGFTGAAELRAQLDHTLVTGTWVDGLPSVDLTVPHTALRADLPGSLAPVEGEVDDEHGTPTGLLLIWLKAGTLAGLEYAWFTDEPPAALPELDRIDIALRT